MEELLDTLCEILGDELERQENVLAQCQGQRDAVRDRDVTRVADRATALQALLRQTADAESRRHEILRRLVEALGLPAEHCSLTRLVEAAPEPWKGRLRHLQGRLRETMAQSRVLARENAVLLRRSVRIVGQCLQHFQPDAPSGTGHYTSSGDQTPIVRQPAALLNQRG